MVNSIILMGRLTRDPEVRCTKSNIPVASYTLAVDRGYKDQNGNSTADFISCVAWDKRADFARDYLHKGQLIAVEGRLQMRSWEDKHGNKRTTFEVIVNSHHFCEGKRADRAPHPADSEPLATEDGFVEIDDGEVPF